MTETINIEKVYRELLALREEVHFIKMRMLNRDFIMTDEEEGTLDSALEEHEQGKTISIEKLKKKLGD